MYRKNVIDVRNDLKVFDVLKKDFCESAIRYLEIIGSSLCIKYENKLKVFIYYKIIKHFFYLNSFR